jgi:hypothetical protein
MVLLVKALVYLLTPFLVMALLHYHIIICVKLYQEYREIVVRDMETIAKHGKSDHLVHAINLVVLLLKTTFKVVMLNLSLLLCGEKKMSFSGKSAGACWAATIQALIGLS